MTWFTILFNIKSVLNMTIWRYYPYNPKSNNYAKCKIDWKINFNNRCNGTGNCEL